VNSSDEQKAVFPQRWAYIVAMILFVHTSAMLLAVTIFVRHNGNDVIPNFYDKAVHWDQIKAANAAATSGGDHQQ
jgi:hypothetical protein